MAGNLPGNFTGGRPIEVHWPPSTSVSHWLTRFRLRAVIPHLFFATMTGSAVENSGVQVCVVAVRQRSGATAARCQEDSGWCTANPASKHLFFPVAVVAYKRRGPAPIWRQHTCAPAIAWHPILRITLFCRSHGTTLLYITFPLPRYQPAFTLDEQCKSLPGGAGEQKMTFTRSSNATFSKAHGSRQPDTAHTRSEPQLQPHICHDKQQQLTSSLRHRHEQPWLKHPSTGAGKA
jgi:hypothetical protein